MGTQAKINKARKQIAQERADRAGVCLAYIHPGQVSSYFTGSLLQLLLRDITAEAMGEHPRRIVNILQDWSSANVSASRNKLTQNFLDGNVGEWLLWIDSDMEWGPDAIEQLLAVADPVKAPIVGGLCFGMAGEQMYPTIYQWAEINGALTTVRVRDYPRSAMVRCAATGAAFVMIHRRVLEAFVAKGFDRAFPFFAESSGGGKPCGEDITFCVRAGMLGFPIYVHTGIRIGHHKSALLTEEEFAKHLPSECPPGVGMVIPTRGDHPELLRAIIAASGLPPERIVVVATADDHRTAAATQNLPATVIQDLGELNIHRWWNRGIDLLAKQGCNRVAILNDDVAISPDTLPRLAWAVNGVAMAVPGDEGTSGHCLMLDITRGVRPDESYRWWCGDLQLWADAADAGGVVRVPDAWCLHLHPNEATSSSPELAALAEADGALYDSRHAGTPNARII